jgi:NhaA family Na+:H+ antiporter
MSTTNRVASPSRPPNPPEAWEPLLKLRRFATRPLERFLQIEAASGILLLAVATAALFWANSRWASGYERLWGTAVSVGFGDFGFERSARWVVNDGLMTIFFFVVGMEIRREIHHGELSEWRRAALPAAAALGGMVIPALLYLSVASDPKTRSGWGVPMATDIAFAIGALALLGKRVPPALRVLLLALAVIDDLGAIVVIALFYSAGIAWQGIAVAAAGVAGIFTFRAMGLRRPTVYVAPAVVVWTGLYSAGIHPTIAGVIIGLLTPVRAWLGTEGFLNEVRDELGRVEAVDNEGEPHSMHGMTQSLRRVGAARREAISPAEFLIDGLHPWVAFAIMPVFALANAGVTLGGASFDPITTKAGWGVIAGLLLGKPIGVVAASFLALRTGVATLPSGLRLRHIVVLGLVAGIGFTMSLFVAQLAFTDDKLLAATKLGVLAASGAAIVIGLAVGRTVLERPSGAGGAETADEAEASAEH